LAAIEAQAETIAKLEATIQEQTKKLGDIRTRLRTDKPGGQTYFDALYRAPSTASSSDPTATLVNGTGPANQYYRQLYCKDAS
jgi:hypothetical protein